MEKPTILCVDDEIDNVEALERLFRSHYSVLKATSGKQALQILDQNPEVALILTDQRMPEMTGVDFLKQAILTHPDSIRILLTGYTDIESVVAAINSGQIYRYLTKPWDPVDLLNTVHRAVERYQMAKEIKEKNRALALALDELKSLDQAKDHFMILINHELKTPLTSVLSFSELLSETSLTEEQELCLQRIQKGSMKLKTIIDDVLVIIGAEAKTLKTKPSPFEFSALDLRVPADAGPMLLQKKLSIKVNPSDKRLIGDLTWITQVVHRILHNAVKYATPESEIEVTTQLTSPHRLKVCIKNKGPQIPPNVVDKVMKPFFIDEDVMNHSVGMGLGLAVSQAILKAHASSLFIQNVADGVEVSFELPCL